MARPKIRIVLLCEDRAQEHFLRGLCQALRLQPVRVVISPRGRGSGEQWVRKQYPSEVKKLRGYGDERVGLLAMTDGDRFGVDQRKRELAEALATAGHAPRNDGERIAIFVPTWSIETWFAWLGGIEGINQSTQYKDDAGFKAARERGEVSPTRAANAWLDGPREDEARQVPSLDDGRREMQRLS